MAHFIKIAITAIIEPFNSNYMRQLLHFEQNNKLFGRIYKFLKLIGRHNLIFLPNFATIDHPFYLTYKSSLGLIIYFEVFVYFFIIVLKANSFIDQAKDLAKKGYLFALAVYYNIFMMDLYGLFAILVQNLQVWDGKNFQFLFIRSYLTKLND